MKTVRFIFAALLLIASTTAVFAEGSGLPPNPPKKTPASSFGASPLMLFPMR